MDRLSRPCTIGLAFLAWGVAAPAGAQVNAPDPTDYREFMAGELFLTEDAPLPEPGDQVIVFFGEQVIGVFTFTSTQPNPREFRILVSGDDPSTPEIEGPVFGDSVTFGFYDSSTNFVRSDVRGYNSTTEEVANVTFRGDEVIQIPGLPLDLTPVQPVDLILGVEGGGPSGGQGPALGGDPDVDGDGEVTRDDAAIVLRIVIRGGRGMSDAEIQRADVNSDGVVSTQDAIAVLRAR